MCCVRMRLFFVITADCARLSNSLPHFGSWLGERQSSIERMLISKYKTVNPCSSAAHFWCDCASKPLETSIKSMNRIQLLQHANCVQHNVLLQIITKNLTFSILKFAIVHWLDSNYFRSEKWTKQKNTIERFNLFMTANKILSRTQFAISHFSVQTITVRA